MTQTTNYVAWLTPPALERSTGVAARRFRRWAAAGKIRAWRTPSGQLLIDPAAIAPLLAEAAAARENNSFSA